MTMSSDFEVEHYLDHQGESFVERFDALTYIYLTRLMDYFDPFAEPTRAYWRGAAVFTCETFGVPVAPGCLTKALANLNKVPAERFTTTSALLRYLIGR